MTVASVSQKDIRLKIEVERPPGYSPALRTFRKDDAFVSIDINGNVAFSFRSDEDQELFVEALLNLGDLVLIINRKPTR